MKKFLAFFLIVFILAAIVLTAYKLFFSKGGEKVDEPPVETSTTQPAVSPSPSPSISPSPDSEDKSEPKPLTSERDSSATLSFSAEGLTEEFAAELFISDFGLPESDVRYSIYIDNERFEYKRDGNTDIFETESGAKMEISLHRATTGEALSPSFMDSYIDFTDIEFEGNSVIGATGLRGFIIDASSSEKSSRAYLINYEGNVIAVVMTFTDEMLEGYVPRMDAMLDTLQPES